MKRNPIEYIKDNNYTLIDIFTSGLYNDLKEFSIIKTFFKEVKVIRPLCISKTKQIDLSPDTSLLQIKIENITSSINFLDKSLKLSKFLNTNVDNDFLNNGMSLTIKEIQIIKEETSIDNKTTINLKNLEQSLSNEMIPLNNISFILLNQKFPIEIKPGEEVLIIIKVNKTTFNFDNIIKNRKNLSQSELICAINPNLNNLQSVQAYIPTETSSFFGQTKSKVDFDLMSMNSARLKTLTNEREPIIRKPTTNLDSIRS
jgi:hypothetical protein